MINRIFALLLITLTLSIAGLNAQISPEQVARKELERRGLGDDEVRLRLEEKGIDVNALDINNPAAIFELEKSLQEVIDEMEAEKIEGNLESKNDPPVSNKLDNLTEDEKKILAKEGENISEAIDDGASLEEAVSEELIDAQEAEKVNAVVYGQEVFRSQSIKLYRQSEDVKPPETYVLGVGDVLAVSIWGNSEEDLIFEINKDGYIKPDGIPRIYLKGLEFSQTKNLLFNRFSKYYNFGKNQFEVTLNFARTINVNITGEVFNYGTFNIPAINTIFNALVAAGGPNNIGSVRKIRHIRPGEIEQIIDIYEYLQDPQYGTKMYLEENDILHIPVSDKIVRIDGAIIRPHSYELLASENLVKLIDYAGGLRANASFKNIQITRYENDIEKIIDVNLGDILSTNKDFILKNGDRIRVNKIPEAFENFATIEGAVVDPGQYSITKNFKVADLIKKTTLQESAFTEVAYLQRSNNDGTFSFFRIPVKEILNNTRLEQNFQLKNNDKLVIYDKSKFVDKEDFNIEGSVRDPGKFEYDFSNRLRLSDAIIMAGGLQKFATDFAYLQRQDPDQADRLQYIRVDIKNAVTYPEGPENLFVEPGDNIVVYNKKDFIDEFEVQILGQVRNPGSHKYDPSLSIQDLLVMSGGLTFQASRKRIDLYRIDINSGQEAKTLAANLILDENNRIINGELDLKPFDIIVVREASEFEKIKTVSLIGEVKYPGIYALISDNEKIESVISRAGGLTQEAFTDGIIVKRVHQNTGVISLLGSEAMKNQSSPHNIILKHYDEVTIPKKNDLVTIYGHHNASQYAEGDIPRINVPFVQSKNAKYYVEKYAGGVTESGDYKKIQVRYSNGTIESARRKFLFFWDYPRVEKGCTINVPYKVDPNLVNAQENTDWNSILTNAVGQATAVLTLILLVQRID